MLMKDCSKLQVFSHGFLQDALTLIKVMDKEGLTKEGIYSCIKQRLEDARNPVNSRAPRTRLEKPCCGGNKVDKQVKAFRERQRKLKVEKAKKSIIDSS